MKLRQALPIAAAAFIGTLASLGILLLSASSERRVAMLDFQSRTADHLSVINADMQDAFSLIETLKAFFEASAEPVTRAEFLKFSTTLHNRVVGLRDTAWAPRITADQREDFEQAVRRDGLADYQIVERAADGKLARARPRAEYYPALYTDPPDGPARALLGINVEVGGERQGTIRRAISTGRPAATAPLKLLSMKAGLGVLAYVPVYRHAPPPGGEPRAPDGLVFGAFELVPMLDHIIAAKRRLAGLDVYLFDPAGPFGHRLIYWRPDKAATGPAPDEAALRALPHLEGTVDMIDRKLGVLFLPSGGLSYIALNGQVLLPAATGLLLTGMICAYLLVSLRRALVQERLTQDLQATTEILQSKTEKITHMARHDALTGLPNRRLFAEALENSVARAMRDRSSCAVLQVDLDRFKPVNDMYGHAAGDAVLCEVAARLRAITDGRTTVARLGGDEFALLIENTHGATGSEAIARQVIEALSQPIVTEQATVAIGASVGIAFCPSDATEPEPLLHAADLAMYSAKREERGTLCRFDARMDTDIRDRLSMEADLRRAIANGDIEPYYQPIIRLADDALVGFEILARWHHAERGVIMPGEFITVAENANLIGDLTYGLLRRACLDAQSWPDHLVLALNLSLIQLKRVELPAYLMAILAQTGFPPARLELEITESALVNGLELARNSLLQMRRAGMHIALDDFGTGYSSLVHLRHLPMDKIKIDQSFVSHMHEDSECMKIVSAIIGLGKSLGIAVTAEGIDTQPLARDLAALGCDFGQGYYFARPMQAMSVTSTYLLHRDQTARPVSRPAASLPPIAIRAQSEAVSS